MRPSRVGRTAKNIYRVRQTPCQFSLNWLKSLEYVSWKCMHFFPYSQKKGFRLQTHSFLVSLFFSPLFPKMLSHKHSPFVWEATWEKKHFVMLGRINYKLQITFNISKPQALDAFFAKPNSVDVLKLRNVAILTSWISNVWFDRKPVSKLWWK